MVFPSLLRFKRSRPVAEGATTGLNEKNEKESISNISQSARFDRNQSVLSLISMILSYH